MVCLGLPGAGGLPETGLDGAAMASESLALVVQLNPYSNSVAVAVELTRSAGKPITYSTAKVGSGPYR